MRKLKKTKVKLLVTLLSFVLLFCGTMGSSLAWLLDTTDPVTNKFDSSTIGVTLTETTNNFKMIPGHTIDKDPVVTVTAGSEDCYVFVKVEKSDNLDQFIEYAIAPNNWEQLKDNEGKDVDGVYIYKGDNYCHKKPLQDSHIKVLGYQNGSEFVSNKVKVKDSVTKEMMDSLTDDTKPTLAFTAYVAQYWKDNTTPFGAYAAWELAHNNPANNATVSGGATPEPDPNQDDNT